MQEIMLEVEGMHCGMCETHVNDVVRRVAGVKKVTSSHRKGQALVLAEDAVSSEAIRSAIEKQGYRVGSVQAHSYEKRHRFFGKK